MKAAIYARVSTTTQEADNQIRDLEAWAERRDLQVARVYRVQESAWRGAHRKALSEVYADARAGHFEILLVWALDRLSREGPQAILETVSRLGRSGVKVWSLQEAWTEASGEAQELLLSIAGWGARMESNRRSERTKAGLERRRAEGKPIGRPRGAKDKARRRRRGYYQRYAT